ncbi:peptidase inhibitor family I36 protein [Glycomyces algeriensis]|uniref:Peptidase inhibitor family I36 n=1 Tax=Glycomyces algeriensis TaxID=256037 RepID=A0A9W6LFE2_9ACTN|nr:peptidase inhibitor family I36 protein [Glycomyces algeriensis]MDA1368958.1 peptidase inhibitor family I36 protein [Glycomyces algeriensis]MDR7353299.1 hypothetical protein [Glycomyces algeriensis]GLI40995.1 hypothetical protein GALLR39Z86_08450 [Glycomyces algeriensis]
MGSEKIASMKRRIKSGAAMAGVAVIAGLGLTAGSAQAETEGDAEILAGGCASGYVCGWENSGYGGDKWVNWRVGGVGSTYEIDWWNGDNEISSISNESNKMLRLYANDGATGAYFCLGPGVDIRNLSDLEPDRNDWIESIRVVSAC